MEESVRIACFGDSLTEGYGLRDEEALPAVLEELLRGEGVNATCLNFGVSGDTTSDGVTRLTQVLDTAPDAVILEFGANDCFVGDPVPVVEENFRTLLSAFQSRGIPVLLVGITALTNLDDEYKAHFDPIFARLAAEYDVPLFPDILASYFGNSMLTLMDGMHPNDQGVRAIARDLLPQVVELARQSTV